MPGVSFNFFQARHQIAEGQGHGSHVLQAMVAVGGVDQWADLGDDPNRRLMGGDDDAIDFVQTVAHQRMQGHRRFAGRLRMEFCRETDLEQHVFHHVAGVFLRQAQLPLALGLERQILVGMAEQHVIETPLRRTQHPGNTHFTAQGDIGKAHATARRIPRRPGLA